MKFGGGTDAPLAEPAIRRRERAEALGRVAAIGPPHTNYQQSIDREIPIVRLSREP